MNWSNIKTATAAAALASTTFGGMAHAEPVTVGTMAVTAAKAAVAHNVAKNFEGAAREETTAAKVAKATTGISVKDIKKHGIWGGRNSFFRKPFG